MKEKVAELLDEIKHLKEADEAQRNAIRAEATKINSMEDKVGGLERFARDCEVEMARQKDVDDDMKAALDALERWKEACAAALEKLKADVTQLREVKEEVAEVVMPAAPGPDVDAGQWIKDASAGAGNLQRHFNVLEATPENTSIRAFGSPRGMIARPKNRVENDRATRFF